MSINTSGVNEGTGVQLSQHAAGTEGRAPSIPLLMTQTGNQLREGESPAQNHTAS